MDQIGRSIFQVSTAGFVMSCFLGVLVRGWRQAFGVQRQLPGFCQGGEHQSLIAPSFLRTRVPHAA